MVRYFFFWSNKLEKIQKKKKSVYQRTLPRMHKKHIQNGGKFAKFYIIYIYIYINRLLSRICKEFIAQQQKDTQIKNTQMSNKCIKVAKIIGD